MFQIVWNLSGTHGMPAMKHTKLTCQIVRRSFEMCEGYYSIVSLVCQHVNNNLFTETRTQQITQNKIYDFGNIHMSQN